MNGKVLVIAIPLIALIFGAVLWYFQTYAYYEEVTGLHSVDVAGQNIPVSDYVGIDADTSPNKLRGCFSVAVEDFEQFTATEDAEPLVAPPWFTCFKAEDIAADLSAGRAVAYLAADETPDSAVGYVIYRYVAVYPDGRAFLWRHYQED